MKGTFKIKQTDGPTQVELAIFHDAPGGGFAEETVSPIAIPQPTDGTNYESQNPEFGRTFDQQDWSGGFGEGRVHTLTSEQHYGYTDGTLAMFPNQIVLGYRETSCGIMVRGGAFEESADIDNWTTSNCSVAHSASSDVGSGAMQATTTGANATLTQSYSNSLGAGGNGISTLQGREINFIARVKRVSGSGTILARINDNVTGNTDGATSSDTSYVTIECTATVNAAATSLSFIFLMSNSGDVWLIDEAKVIPTGGTTWSCRPVSFKGTHSAGLQLLYAGIGRCVMVWHEADETFYPMYVDSANTVTDLEQFGDSTTALFVALGDTNTYKYSTDGTTWSNPSNLTSGNADYADKFVRAQNAAGNNVLMKARATNIAINATPTDAATWGSEIPVGTSDRPVTSLLATNGIAYVGKTDGMYVFDRANSKMRDIEPDANFFADSNNFEATIGRGGVVYSSGGQSTFWRIWPAEEGAIIHRWTDLTDVLGAPAFKYWGGRVAALAQDRINIWVLTADDAGAQSGGFPYTFPFVFEGTNSSSAMRLITLRPPTRAKQDFVSDNALVPHSVTAINSMTTATQLGRFISDPVSSLFVLGARLDTSLSLATPFFPVAVRLKMPVSNDNPALAASVEVRKTGNFYTQWMDWDFPDIEKTLLRVALSTKNCSTGKTVTVYYKTDDASDDDSSGWTQFPDESTKVNSSPTTVLSVDTSDETAQITFKRIRFKLAIASNSFTDDPPTIVGMTVSIQQNAGDYRKFRAVAKVGDRRFTTSRRRNEMLPAETIITRLKELQAEPYVTVTTPLGDEYVAWIRFAQEIASNRVVGYGRRTDQTRILTIEGTEVRTT